MKPTTPDIRSLETRRDALLDSLRSLGNLMRGSLYTARVRCGVPSCECALGKKHEKQHLSVNLHGRTRNVYVGERRAVQVAALIAEYNRAWRIIDELTEINVALLRATSARGAARKGQS
jgi:hypothetical protein